MRGFTFVCGALLALAGPAAAQPAAAQSTPAQSGAVQTETAGSAGGWTFSVTPYLWLPTVDTSLRYRLPNNVVVGVNPSIDAGEYIGKLRFGATLAADARYDRFSVLTDILYLSLGGSRTRLASLNVAGVESPSVSAVRNYGASENIQTTIWTLGGGYTLSQGAWGMVEAFGGFRLLAVDTTTNYGLSAELTTAAGATIPVLGRSGSLTASKDVWNGIGGVRGRIALGESRFYLPYYFDVGKGDSKFTWQTNVGVGYQAGWADLSVGYRYMLFEQYQSAVVRKLALSGAIVEASFHF